MSSQRFSTFRIALLGGFFSGAMTVLFGLAGCGTKAPEKAELPPPWVTVSAPIERMVSRYEYARGRCEPLEQVQIRARVSGYLNKVAFEPGREVEKGKLLLEIDPEPFKADLAKAKANLASAKFDLQTAKAELIKTEARQYTTKQSYDREETAYKKGVGSVADRDIAKGMYDEAVATFQAGNARIEVANAKIEEGKANVRTAELNLGYCSITAPIAGIIGDKLVTEGNLVTGGVGNTTLLTTIVADEKMDVAFDVDENTLERIQQSMRDGKIKFAAPGEIPAEAGLSLHGTDYPLKGKINFADNQFDQKTGTIRMKARFDNPKPATGSRLLTAGMYAHVRVPIGEPVQSMLVPDTAFGFDQGIRYLYVVGPDNKAIRVDAATGNLDGDMRVVESVLAPGEGKHRPLSLADQVIVTGIQKIRPGMTVDPKPAKK
jgi:RND family efflux transporter MFP subunit